MAQTDETPILDSLWPESPLPRAEAALDAPVHVLPSPPPSAASAEDVSAEPRWFHDPTTRPPQDVERSATYHAKTPEPNYAAFGERGPTHIDRDGREYIVDASSTGDSRRVRLFFRIPIRLHDNVLPPSPQGEELELYKVHDQTTLTGRTDGVFITSARKKTGHMFLLNPSYGRQVIDPEPFERWLQVKRKRTGPIV